MQQLYVPDISSYGVSPGGTCHHMQWQPTNSLLKCIKLMRGNIASALNTIRCHFVVNFEQLHWMMQ